MCHRNRTAEGEALGTLARRRYCDCICDDNCNRTAEGEALGTRGGEAATL